MKWTSQQATSLSQPAFFRIHFPPLPLFTAILFLLNSIFLSNTALCTENLPVKIGFYENSPKIFLDQDRKVSGFWPELIEHIALKEQWKIEYVHGTWSEGLARLRSHEIDILPDVAYTAKRGKIFAFSEDTVLMSWSRLYIHNKNTSIQSIQDLSNKKIAALKDSVNLEGAGGFRELLENFNISCTFVELDDYRDVFQAIADKRVDAGITNRNFGNKHEKKYGLQKTPVLFQPINIKFAFPRNSSTTTELGEKINSHMKAMKADENSVYYQLLKKYFEAEIAEKEVVVLPEWLKNLLQLLTLLLISFFAIIVATRFQVQRKTKKLIESEEGMQRLTTAIDQAAETIVITDLKGRIQYVNPAFAKLTGYSCEEARDKNPRILKSGKHDQLFYKKMWATLLQGKTWKGHLINKKKDGSLFEEEATISPVRNSDGKITNFVAVKRDVSREVELENQLRQSIKMEAIGTMAGGIAHDFNNILTAIIGYAEFIQIEAPEEGRIGSDAAGILISAKRAADLVRQILTFSRQDIGEKHLLKPHLIVKESLKMLRATLPATLIIEEDIDPDCGTILANPTTIHQIVVNLCTNALHAMTDQKGTVQVSLLRKELSRDDLPHERDLCAGPFIVLSVTDSGCGMEQNTIGRAFEPYFTTREPGRGTGLGLAVVHGAVSDYDGFIRIQSCVGKGSTFSVFLPVTKLTSSPPETQQQKNRREAIASNRRILIVDDETLIVKINETRLKGQGYQVTAVSNSSEALEIFRKAPYSFDMLITDQTMPGFTGFELAQAVLKIRPSIPIIMCTGHSDIVSKEEALKHGIDRYVLNPLCGDELLDTVNELMPEADFKEKDSK